MVRPCHQAFWLRKPTSGATGPSTPSGTNWPGGNFDNLTDNWEVVDQQTFLNGSALIGGFKTPIDGPSKPWPGATDFTLVTNGSFSHSIEKGSVSTPSKALEIPVARQELQQIVTEVNNGIAAIRNLAVKYNVTLLDQDGNSAVFSVSADGVFYSNFYYVSGNDASDTKKFLEDFYAVGGPYDQTYGKTSILKEKSDKLAALIEYESQVPTTLNLTCRGNITNHPYNIVHGPYIISKKPVFLNKGDIVEFWWKASGNLNHGFDFFSYLLNSTQGTTQTLREGFGTPNQINDWTLSRNTVSTTGNYKFVFMNGSWDSNGTGTFNGSTSIVDLKIYPA